MMIYAHPFTFSVEQHEADDGGWTKDCGGKRDYDPEFIRFSCRVYPDGNYICSMLLGENVLRETGVRHGIDMRAARRAVEDWCAAAAEEVTAALSAQWIEARSGETRRGSIEDESAVGEADAPKSGVQTTPES